MMSMSDAQRTLARMNEGFAAAADMIGGLLTAWEESQRELAASQAQVAALRDACAAALAYIPGSEVRSWPPGFRLRDEALSKLRAALAQPTDDVVLRALCGRVFDAARSIENTGDFSYDREQAVRSVLEAGAPSHAPTYGPDGAGAGRVEL